MQRLKIIVCWLAKLSGLFLACHFLMRRHLLILCYHGIQFRDEGLFRPKTFMRESVFRARLAALERHRFRALPLSDALAKRRAGTLPDFSVCITFDEPFYSAVAKAVPLLKQRNMPATFYVTSYYVQKCAPVFRLVVQYMFWSSKVETLDLSDQTWAPREPMHMSSSAARDQAAWAVINYGETHCSETERQSLSSLLGSKLGVSYEQLVASRMLNLATEEELQNVANDGVDVQLHTHRHRLPGDDEVQFRREIRENREFLRRANEQEATHLAYPSGIWDRQQWQWLAEEGVASATTCEPGFNTTDTPLFGLYRFVDRDDMPEIVFEAEICGFMELLRIVSGKRRAWDSLRRIEA